MSGRAKWRVAMENLESQVDDEIIEVEMIVLVGSGGGSRIWKCDGRWWVEVF